MATLERTLEQNDYTQTSENQGEQYQTTIFCITRPAILVAQ
jgi:hypothetical protein